MGKNGKDRIRSNYTMEKHLKVINDLIDKVIINKN